MYYDNQRVNEVIYLPKVKWKNRQNDKINNTSKNITVITSCLMRT